MDEIKVSPELAMIIKTLMGGDGEVIALPGNYETVLREAKSWKGGKASPKWRHWKAAIKRLGGQATGCVVCSRSFGKGEEAQGFLLVSNEDYTLVCPVCDCVPFENAWEELCSQAPGVIESHLIVSHSQH